ncbi:MAG: GGDEF domain-containing protein [Bdellovibrionota bacterium]
MSLRLKIFISSLLSALIVAAGSTWLFSKTWVELAQSYGLLSIEARLANLSENSDFKDSGEWAMTMEFAPHSADRHAQWFQAPVDQSTPEALKKIEMSLFTSISRTNLRSGSFEITLKSGEHETPYFVVFRSSAKLGEENKINVAGTKAQLSLNELSPLAAPFLGFLVLALGISAFIAWGISLVLERSYTLLERALENIGAGRLTKLNLPTSKDPAVQRISRALQSMVTVLQNQENEIAKVSALALEDPMTKIPNFRSFNVYVDKLLTDKSSVVASKTLLVIIDLDFFKKVNDNHGHQVGDFVLKEAAKLIKNNIRYPNERSPDRVPDFCARYGGEEFVAIFNDVAMEDRQTPVLRILQAIKNAELQVPKDISSNGKSFTMKISASMGMALWDPKRFKEKDAWIKEADESLYAAKEGGRGRICAIYPEKAQWL